MEFDPEILRRRNERIRGLTVIALVFAASAAAITMGLGGGAWLSFGIGIMVGMSLWLGVGMIVAKASVDEQQRKDDAWIAVDKKMARSDLDRLPREGV